MSHRHDYTRPLILKGDEFVTLLEFLLSDAPASEKLWICDQPELLSDHEYLLIVADFAERAVLSRWRDRWDFRPAAAVVATRRFAGGAISRHELNVARTAAAGAGYSDWSLEAASAAAADALAAGGDRAAARAAELEEQVAIVRRYLEVQP